MLKSLNKLIYFPVIWYYPVQSTNTWLRVISLSLGQPLTLTSRRGHPQRPSTSLTLPLAYERLTNSHILRWIHNNTVIFYRQGKVSTGKPEDITSNGSLVLKKILFSSQGIYKGHVLHPNNTSAKTWTGRLCVLDKVSKPQLSYSCDFSSMAINLNCHVTKPEGLVFSWTLDKETLKSETKQTLSISFIDLKAERSFTCDVANKISKASSDKVRPTCPPLLSFKRQTVMAVLAGGGGLILFLLFVIVGFDFWKIS
uniref:Ig-like domain-containing protein n=1 Tax=Haplochromis burtoni TaxID=8153 RepID=A0A3Q2WAC6_HAPBU